MKTIEQIIIVVVIVGVVCGVTGYIVAPKKAAETSLPGEGFKIIGFTHTDPGDICWEIIESGAEAAAEQLGASFVMRYFEGSLEDQANAIRVAAEGDADLILTSIIDPYLFDDPIQLCINNGKTVMAWIDDDLMTENPRQGIITYPSLRGRGGADYYAAWVRMEELEKDMYLHDGLKMVVPACDLTADYCIEVIDAVNTYLEEGGYKDYTVDIIETTFDLGTIEERERAYFVGHPDVEIVLTTGWISSTGVVLAMEHTEMEPGDVIHYSWVLNDIDARGIEEGYSQKGITFSPASIGYLSVLDGFFVATTGLRAVEAEIDLIWIDQSNVGEFIEGIAEFFF